MALLKFDEEDVFKAQLTYDAQSAPLLINVLVSYGLDTLLRHLVLNLYWDLILLFIPNSIIVKAAITAFSLGVAPIDSVSIKESISSAV